MKVLGQPIFFIIWRFSLLRGTNVLNIGKSGTLEKFHYERFSLLGGFIVGSSTVLQSFLWSIFMRFIAKC